MCRLLGIVASERTPFRALLKDAPRSLGTLARQHKDGWGLAVHDGGRHGAWSVDLSVRSAADDEDFHKLAAEKSGAVMVSHVRLATVGGTRLENTHPFVRGPWVFAHNGTIRDLDYLRAGSSEERLAELTGDTDSERFFAYLLTRLDAAGCTDGPADEHTDAVVAEATRSCRERAGAPAKDNPFGVFNFLLSNGDACYAHRFGRTLHVLERSPSSGDVTRGGGVVPCTRRPTIFVASEAMTDERWEAVDEGVLLRIDRAPVLRIQTVS
ncbi:MAG TPA: class II glutamine amidotransferase [Polyangiaceae bacterium]